MKSTESFARLLTEGVHRISLQESKNIAVIQDELGYALNKKGGSSVEYWRKGNIPVRMADIEVLARELTRRGGLERSWLERFLRSAGHPAADTLVDELFPEPETDRPAKLSIAFQDEGSHLSIPVDTVPFPASLPPGSYMPLRKNPLFTGRDPDLMQLASTIGQNNVATVSQLETAAATGLGGIGKTQLACEFVHRYGQFFTGGVFWLSFADPDSIAAEIAACGGPGGLDLHANFGSLTLHEQLRLVQSAWQRPVPRLLVFDNCEDPELLNRWRPVSGGCRILITSRRGDWEHFLGVKMLALGVLKRVDSIKLLLQHRPDEDIDNLDGIAAELGDLPLALHLAGSYLYRYRRVIDGARYLEQLRDPDLLHHPSMLGIGISPTGHVQHVGRTFALSYDRLDPDDAIDALARSLLFRAAHFAPGEPIWYELLVKTLDLDEDGTISAIQADRAFSRLIELGLIEVEDDFVLRMHRLVAAFVHDVAGQEVQEARAAVEAAVYAETIERNKVVAPLPLLRWQIHLRTVADISAVRADVESARLCNELGQHLWQIGDYRGALAYHRKALAIRVELLGEDHLESAESLANLGRTLRALGQSEESSTYFERALSIRLGQLDQTDVRIAESLDDWGRYLYEQGDLQSARDFFQRAVEQSRKQDGIDTPATAEYLNNQGACLRGLGELEESVACLNEALRINSLLLGPEHPHVATNYHNLGTLYRQLGETERAKEYLQRALKIRLSQYGEEHPDSARTLLAIGALYFYQREELAADEYLNRALAAFTNSLGADHLDVAECADMLGRYYHSVDNLERASAHLQNALRIRQMRLPPDHRLIEESRGRLDELAKQ